MRRSDNFKISRRCSKFGAKEFHTLCSSQKLFARFKSERMRWAGHVARVGKKKNVRRALAWSLKGKRALERLMFRWENNIKMAWHGLNSPACGRGESCWVLQMQRISWLTEELLAS